MTAGSIEGAGTYFVGSKALTVGLNNLSTEVSGTIEDGGQHGGTGGALIKVGTGTLTLTGANTYSGGTTVAAGVLSVANDANLGASTGTLTLQGGEILTTNANFSSARLVTLNTSVPPNILAATTGTTAIYSGVISGAGGLHVGDGTNTGTVFLASLANNYQGGTTVSGGATLMVNSDAELGDLGGITLNGGKLATLNFQTARTLTVEAGTNILAAQSENGFTNAEFDGQVTGTGALTIGDSNSSQYTVVLTNLANDYAGGTTITGGATVVVDSNSELGSGVLTLAGGTLRTANGFTSGRAITLVPGVVAKTLATQFESTSTYTGEIGGSGGLTIAGGGTVVLAGVNNYMGGTHILFAILSVAHDTNLGNVNGGITLEGGTLLTTTDGFTSARPILLNEAEGHNTLAAISGTTATYTGLISGNGSLTVGAFNDLGEFPQAGTVVLTNHLSSYTGGTTVTNGAILSVNNDGVLGATIGGLTLQGGELLTSADGFVSARTIKLENGVDTLAAVAGTTATYTGAVSRNGVPLLIGDFVNIGTGSAQR
jgi:autotransporter-associated beta strand protein